MGALVAALPVALGGTAAASSVAIPAASLAALNAAGIATSATALGAGAAAGGLGAASLFSGISSAASVLGGLSSLSQGMQAKEAANMQSRQIELQGRMNAIQVQDELLKNLATNNVAAASSGLKSAGTPLYAQQQSQLNANEEMRIQRLNTDVKKAEAKQAGEAAASKGVTGLATGVMTAGERIGSSLSEKAKTKK